jgi:hypothetical protein
MHNRDTNTLTPLGVEWVRRKNGGRRKEGI